MKNKILAKAAADDCLSVESMTTAINEIKRPNTFVRDLLFRATETHMTVSVELSFWQRGRQIAPFVKRGAEAEMVGGPTKDFHNVTPPCIRIKKPMTAYEKSQKRLPGYAVFNDAGRHQAMIQEAIAKDIESLGFDIDNAEEFLACMALRGTVTYTDVTGDVWTVVFPKPAGNTFNAPIFWDNADPTLPNPVHDFITAKEVISDEVNLQPSHVILGEEAMAAFLALTGKNSQIQIQLDNRRMSAGQVQLENDFTEAGAIFLGRVAGLSVWGYTRSVSVGGVSTPLIRPKYAEVVTTSAQARNVMHYGMVDDMDALEARQLATRRFAKSWKTPDPSVHWELAHSCPLAVTERAGAHVSIQVVA